jgi:hypothetical protein
LDDVGVQDSGRDCLPEGRAVEPPLADDQLTVTVKVVVAVVLAASLPVPVTVKVYIPAVVPGLLVLPPPLLLAPPPPQAAKLPRAQKSASKPSNDCQLRRRDGSLRRNSNASPAPPRPARLSPFLRKSGRISVPVVASVVDTVAVAFPPAGTAALGIEQAGASPLWFAGPPELSAQVIVTVPVYPLVELTKMAEVAVPPGATAVVAPALNEYVSGGGAVTVTVAELLVVR